MVFLTHTVAHTLDTPICSWLQQVRAATTANIIIATTLNNGNLLDGVTLATGDRVLVKDQSTASENGIYVVGASPARADDMPAGNTVVHGAAVVVLAGTANAGALYYLDAGADDFTVIVGTTAMPWSTLGGITASSTDDLSNKTLLAPRIQSSTTANDYVVGVSSLAADRTVTLPLLTGNDTFVFEAHTQTLTNKTLTSPTVNTILHAGGGSLVVNTSGTATVPSMSGSYTLATLTGTEDLSNKTLLAPRIQSGTTANDYIISVNALAASRTVSLPTLTGNDTFVFETHAQTLTNKTVTSATINGGTVTSATISEPVFVWREACRAASTANVTIASQLENGDSLDGVILATGDRVLLKDQSTGSENGIYVVVSSGPASRAADLDSDADADVGCIVRVSEGLTNDNSVWEMTNDAGITINTDSLVFQALGSTQTETLSNKTLTLPQINDAGEDHRYVFDVNELTSNRTVTLPLLTDDAEFMMMNPSTVITASFTALENTFYPLDTDTNAITVTLPAITADTNGARIVVGDFTGNASNNNITISPASTDAVGSQVSANVDDTIQGDFNTITMMAVYNGGTNPRWMYL